MLITQWWLTIERRVICQKFQHALKNKRQICIVEHLNILCFWQPFTSFLDSRESRELQSLGQHLRSCNVSSPLDIISDFKRLVSVYLEQNFECLDLFSVLETWVSGLVSVSAQKVSCTSLLVWNVMISCDPVTLVFHLYWWKGVATLPLGARDMSTVVMALWLLA